MVEEKSFCTVFKRNVVPQPGVAVEALRLPAAWHRAGGCFLQSHPLQKQALWVGARADVHGTSLYSDGVQGLTERVGWPPTLQGWAKLRTSEDPALQCQAAGLVVTEPSLACMAFLSNSWCCYGASSCSGLCPTFPNGICPFLSHNGRFCPILSTEHLL